MRLMIHNDRRKVETKSGSRGNQSQTLKLKAK